MLLPPGACGAEPVSSHKLQATITAVASKYSSEQCVKRLCLHKCDEGRVRLNPDCRGDFRRCAAPTETDDPAAAFAEITARLSTVTSPFRTAEHFLIEDIIDPRDTRPLPCEFTTLAQGAL
jgi:hypothetical protein